MEFHPNLHLYKKINTMKTVKIVLTLLVAITLSCNGQANRTAMKNDEELELIKAPVSIGLGTLDISFDLPVPLYRTENDITPIDVLTFVRAEDGVWHYETKNLKSFKLYKMYGGNSHDETKRNISVGLTYFPPELSFRVLYATDSYWRVVINETGFETVVIRRDPDYDLLQNRLKFSFDNTTQKPYKGSYAYETWEDLLKRAILVSFNGNYAVYDAPEGKKIIEKTKSDNYKVTEVCGDWVKIERSGRQEGWAKWKSDTEIFVEIIERIYR